MFQSVRYQGVTCIENTSLQPVGIGQPAIFALSNSNHSVKNIIIIVIIIIILVFLGPHLQHMDIPRLGIESEMQLPAYTTATAMAKPDPSHTCSNAGSLTH